MKTILVVDDEPEIVALCSDYLRASGYAVLAARDGQAALDAVRSSRPDLVVLDLGLPKVDGLDVTRAVRRESAVPIIMLTARTEETDKLVGLELGADDYLTKPFSPKELVARVRAVLRRAEGAHEAVEIVRAGDVELDLARMLATIAGRRVELTPTEFRLLLELARQPGTGLHPLAAPVRRAGRRVRVVRARDRRPRQEHPPQDRGRPRGLRGGCRPCSASATGWPRSRAAEPRVESQNGTAPAWLPADQPWPPPGARLLAPLRAALRPDVLARAAHDGRHPRGRRLGRARRARRDLRLVGAARRRPRDPGRRHRLLPDARARCAAGWRRSPR